MADIIPTDKTMTTSEAAGKWNATTRSVAAWCKDGLIGGARKTYRWLIPVDALRPIDKKLAREIIWSIVEVELGLLEHPDLTEWGIRHDQIARYLESLVNEGYLEKCSPDNDADIRITKKGFALIGRCGSDMKQESFNPMRPLIELVVEAVPAVIDTALRLGAP